MRLFLTAHGGFMELPSKPAMTILNMSIGTIGRACRIFDKGTENGHFHQNRNRGLDLSFPFYFGVFRVQHHVGDVAGAGRANRLNEICESARGITNRG
jgi:hypothetical protein